jgi:hypothetical protein
MLAVDVRLPPAAGRPARVHHQRHTYSMAALQRVARPAVVLVAGAGRLLRRERRRTGAWTKSGVAAMARSLPGGIRLLTLPDAPGGPRLRRCFRSGGRGGAAGLDRTPG